MIFTDYWKVLVLNFSVMQNTVFLSAKRLMERWYLLGLFELSMIFQYLGNMVFHAVSSLSWLIAIVYWIFHVSDYLRSFMISFEYLLYNVIKINYQLMVFYLYHCYFYIQYNCYSKSCIILLGCNNLLLDILISLITL